MESEFFGSGGWNNSVHAAAVDAILTSMLHYSRMAKVTVPANYWAFSIFNAHPYKSLSLLVT